MTLTSLLAAMDSKQIIMMVVVVAIFAVMIVLTVVPQKKRQKEQQNMLNSLSVGTKLMTVGGIVGKITQVNADSTLVVNVGTENNPTLIVIDKKAVGYVLEKVDAPAAPVVEEKTDDKKEETVECDNNCDACDAKADCDKAENFEPATETTDCDNNCDECNAKENCDKAE